MTQFYSDPSRESDPHALPDAETFYISASQAAKAAHDAKNDAPPEYTGPTGEGWYYWFCFPGCMPDGDPSGPFKTEQEAIESAREPI